MNSALPVLLLVCAMPLIADCADPVHDNEVTALGGEAPGVSPGPTHRPGQPCLTCHGGEGPGSPQFSFAGTVFEAPSPSNIGISGVTVKLTDSTTKVTTVTSNSVGNFFILASDYTPAWPVDAELDYGTVQNPMLTHINRDGGCASCHFDPAGISSPGHVYLVGDVSDLPDGGGQ